MSSVKLIALGIASLVIAAAVWVPSLHLVYRPDVEEYFGRDKVAPRARELADYHMKLWTDPERFNKEIKKMRRSNAEWDFMGRTFLVCALSNMAIRDPGFEGPLLQAMDRIISETLRLESEEGMYHFLMPYAKTGDFKADPQRSQFIDGEIALMLAHRRMVEEKKAYKELLARRVSLMVDRMKLSPVLSAESYPDECWTFCNSIGLAAIKMADVLDGSDHSDFLREWIDRAKKELVHPQTGLLVSSYTVSGEHLDGPEGSSIWMASHALQVVDEEFAADQYERARKELAGNFLGFGYAREWPDSWVGPVDIDSGPVLPVIKISPGSSGLALLGAASHDDTGYLRQLLTSLNFAAFPSEKEGLLKYHASNQVGDAVLLYAFMQGPVWRKVKEGGKQ